MKAHIPEICLVTREHIQQSGLEVRTMKKRIGGENWGNKCYRHCWVRWVWASVSQFTYRSTTDTESPPWVLLVPVLSVSPVLKKWSKTKLSRAILICLRASRRSLRLSYSENPLVNASISSKSVTVSEAPKHWYADKSSVCVGIPFLLEHLL